MRLPLSEPGEVSLTEARKIADMAADAVVKHERAYRAARTPPPALRRRPHQEGLRTDERLLRAVNTRNLASDK